MAVEIEVHADLARAAERRGTAARRREPGVGHAAFAALRCVDLDQAARR